MKASLVLGAGRGPRLEVLELIRRSSDGMSVKALSSKLNMSYMGVKAHCIALTSTGHLTTWRQPTTKGRPQMVYRLTEKGRQLFAESGPDLALQLLKESEGLFGNAAPQKLLMMYFRSLTATYREVMTAVDPANRVSVFVRLRDAEGRISSLREGSTREILECHNPLASVMKLYPGAAAMEESMVGEVLGAPVRRAEIEGGVVFTLP
jgi:predicted ArsR family transcriptional regulator